MWMTGPFAHKPIDCRASEPHSSKVSQVNRYRAEWTEWTCGAERGRGGIQKKIMSTSIVRSNAKCDVNGIDASAKKVLQSSLKLSSHKQTYNLATHTAVCSETPTILITNYSHNPSIASHCGGDNNNTKRKSSSITISVDTHNTDSKSPATLPAPSINILINNHFDRPLIESVSTAIKNDDGMLGMPLTAVKIEKMQNGDANDGHKESAVTRHNNNNGSSSCSSSRSSRSSSRSRSSSSNGSGSDAANVLNQRNSKYRLNSEVLVQHDDGRVYLGTVNEIDEKKCLIKYDDNTTRWTNLERITNWDVRDDDGMTKSICIACKNNGDVDGMVYTCGACCRTYHEKCMNGMKTKKTGQWQCQRCITRTISNKDEEKPKLPKLGNPAGNQLPYDLNELTWDAQHLQNEQQIYCYCGKNGKWYMQMLQCVRCLQWFHAKCVKCLNAPLYLGDRFYLFACANCNHGVEFSRRRHLSMEDVVHLMMFNLSLHYSRNYFDLANVIGPYIKDNWHALQLPPKLKSMTSNDIKDETAKVLRSKSITENDLFKRGRKVKEKVLSWALNVRAPPAAHIAMPQGPMLTEKYINDLFCEPARIYYIPQNLNSTESVANDAKMRSLMCGRNYAQFIENYETSSSSDTDSVDDVLTTASDEEFLAELVWQDQPSQRHIELNDCDNSLTGYDTTMVKGKKRLSGGANGSVEVKKRGRPLKVDRRNEFLLDFCDSSDDTSSRGTLDSIIPPPKDFSGSNNPFLMDNSNSSNSPMNSSGSATGRLNFTNSISKGVGVGGATNGNSDKNQVRLVRTVKRRLSARDILIGPNMEIKRRKVKHRSDENVEVISTTTLEGLPKSASYLPIRGDPKDISIAALRSSLGGASSTKNGTTNVSTKTENGRRLRQRLDKTVANVQKSQPNDMDASTLSSASNALAFGNSSIPGSPIKGAVGTDAITDLHTSVNAYFGGVSNRIANGECFVVKGKRVTLDGRLQYLVEWEGVS